MEEILSTTNIIGFDPLVDHQVDHQVVPGSPNWATDEEEELMLEELQDPTKQLSPSDLNFMPETQTHPTARQLFQGFPAPPPPPSGMMIESIQVKQESRPSTPTTTTVKRSQVPKSKTCSTKAGKTTKTTTKGGRPLKTHIKPSEDLIKFFSNMVTREELLLAGPKFKKFKASLAETLKRKFKREFTAEDDVALQKLRRQKKNCEYAKKQRENTSVTNYKEELDKMKAELTKRDAKIRELNAEIHRLQQYQRRQLGN